VEDRALIAGRRADPEAGADPNPGTEMVLPREMTNPAANPDPKVVTSPGPSLVTGKMRERADQSLNPGPDPRVALQTETET